MTETITPGVEQPTWRARTVLLVAIGAVTAWLVWWIMDLDNRSVDVVDAVVRAQRFALATGISVAALAFGFGLERVRIRWTLIFAPALGLVAGLILWWGGDVSKAWSWSGASLFLAIAIALPLFQVVRDEGRWSFPYDKLHGYALTNIVIWGACWIFAWTVMLVLLLLGELFRLIGIDLLYDLIQKHGWFPALVIGGGYGAALGMLRDLDHIVRLLQRVLISVFSVLAPVLAFGLLVFLLSLPFTGLHRLWETTRSTTPILIACCIGALVLINAVIGHGPDDEAKSPVLRWAAMALGLTILPLAVVAAIATGLRIYQYGFTPDRLWALVTVVLGTVYGVVYLAALIRKRHNWAAQLRPDNIRLAFGTMVLALLLATPLIGFNSLSANSQVARLKSGKVSVDKFDWAALAFDFGEPGKRALRDLSRAMNQTIAARAIAVMKVKNRWEVNDDNEDRVAVSTFDIRPAGAILPEALKAAIVEDGMACGNSVYCRVYLQPDGKTAAAIGDGCMALPPEKRIDPSANCQVFAKAFVLRDSRWLASDQSAPLPTFTTSSLPEQRRASLKKERDAIDAGQVEIRDVPQRQLFIGGVPVGSSFKP